MTLKPTDLTRLIQIESVSGSPVHPKHQNMVYNRDTQQEHESQAALLQAQLQFASRKYLTINPANKAGSPKRKLTSQMQS